MQAKTTQWRYTVDEKSGCWLWRGALTDEGYAAFNRSGSERRAHREFYVVHVAAIPIGYQLHHVCGIKHCVNPAHLVPVTIGEHNRVEGNFADQEDHARALRASGLSYVRIAAELGCSRTTAYRLVNPAYKQANVQYKRDRPEHYRELRIAYRKRLAENSPNRCVECGAGMNPRGKAGGICIACRAEHSVKRKQEIQRLWNDGQSLPQIAERLNTTVNSVGVTMTQMRDDGWELPLRYKMTDGRRMPA